MGAFRLLYETALLAVSHAAAAALYGFPAAALFTLTAANWIFAATIGDWPLAIRATMIFLAFSLFLLANVNYAVETMRRMQDPLHPRPFRTAMRWSWSKTEFLATVSVGAASFAALSFFLGDLAISIYDASISARARETAQLSAEADLPRFGIGAGLGDSFAFGSRALAVIVALLAFFLWVCFTLSTIKIPAHCFGVFVSFSEARELTRGHTHELLAAGAAVNLGLIGVFAVLWAEFRILTGGDGEAISSILPGGAFGNLFAACGLGFAYWTIAHFNFALWTASYHMFAEGQVALRKEIYYAPAAKKAESESESQSEDDDAPPPPPPDHRPPHTAPSLPPPVDVRSAADLPTAEPSEELPQNKKQNPLASPLRKSGGRSRN